MKAVTDTCRFVLVYEYGVVELCTLIVFPTLIYIVARCDNSLLQSGTVPRHKVAKIYNKNVADLASKALALAL